MSDDRATVRVERPLNEPPETVWLALTDRDQLKAWFPSDVIVDGGVWIAGTRVFFEFPQDIIDLTLTGDVLAVDEPNVLSYTRGDETLRFELSPDGEGSRLVVLDELNAAIAARNAAGWEQCLDRLQGVDPAESWQERFDRYVAEFEPAYGPQEGPPSEVKVSAD